MKNLTSHIILILVTLLITKTKCHQIDDRGFLTNQQNTLGDNCRDPSVAQKYTTKLTNVIFELIIIIPNCPYVHNSGSNQYIKNKFEGYIQEANKEWSKHVGVTWTHKFRELPDCPPHGNTQWNHYMPHNIAETFYPNGVPKSFVFILSHVGGGNAYNGAPGGVMGLTNVIVFLHELGHNFGLGHYKQKEYPDNVAPDHIMCNIMFAVAGCSSLDKIYFLESQARIMRCWATNFLGRDLNKYVIPGGAKEIRVVEKEYVTIDCGKDTITMVSSFFGNEEKNCKKKYANRKVKKVCEDEFSCTFKANNYFFKGDPCPGTDKYLIVKYKCKTPSTLVY